MKICKAPRGTIVKLVPKREGTDGWTVDRSIDRYTYKFSRVECGPWRICRNNGAVIFIGGAGWMDWGPASRAPSSKYINGGGEEALHMFIYLIGISGMAYIKLCTFFKTTTTILTPCPVPSRPIHHVLCSQLTFYGYDWGSDTAVSPSQSVDLMVIESCHVSGRVSEWVSGRSTRILSGLYWKNIKSMVVNSSLGYHQCI